MAAARRARTLFEADAVAGIFQHSRGVPRQAQDFALGAVLAAANADKTTVDIGCVQQALLDQEAA